MSKLREILTDMGESFYPFHEYGDSYRDQNKEVLDQAETAIKAYILEIIGDDETDDNDLSFLYAEHRNQLRAEQRNRLDMVE